MKTTPKRPSKLRPVHPAQHPRHFEEFDRRAQLVNETPDDQEIDPADRILFVPDGAGGQARLLQRDLRITYHFQRHYSPWHADGRVKLLGREPDAIRKISWSYATPYDFRFAGFPKPTSKELEPAMAKGFLDVARDLIAANINATDPLIQANGLTLQADALGVVLDSPMPTKPGAFLRTFLIVPDWHPFTSRNGGKWCLPPDGAEPYGVYWGGRQA